jgi:hypothetical protein
VCYSMYVIGCPGSAVPPVPSSRWEAQGMPVAFPYVWKPCPPANGDTTL